MTPQILHRINLEYDASCPKCHIEMGIYVHIWLGCPWIQRFGVAVIDRFSALTELTLQLMMKICLLGLVPKKGQENNG